MNKLKQLEKFVKLEIKVIKKRMSSDEWCDDASGYYDMGVNHAYEETLNEIKRIKHEQNKKTNR